MTGEHHLALLAEQAFERLGDYDQLLFEGTWHTSGEIDSRARRAATGLGAIGIEPGDRVIVLTMNTPEVFVALPRDLARGCGRDAGDLPADADRAAPHPGELRREGGDRQPRAACR